jgi:hypothetical protein
MAVHVLDHAVSEEPGLSRHQFDAANDAIAVGDFTRGPKPTH